MTFDLGNRVITETTSKRTREMKPTEQFALVLRIMGLLGIGYIMLRFVRNPNPPTLPLVFRLLGILIGAYFIRGAPLLVEFAYPEYTPEPPPKTSR
jgi:hypothetical protein